MATNRTNPGRLEEKNKLYHTNNNKTHLEVGIILGANPGGSQKQQQQKLGVKFRKAGSRVGPGVWMEQGRSSVCSGPVGHDSVAHPAHSHQLCPRRDLAGIAWGTDPPLG